MFAVKSSADFLNEIKKIDDKLANIKLKSIEVIREDSEIIYHFICDQSIDADLKQKIVEIVNKNTLKAFDSIKVYVNKIVSNSELVNDSIFRYLNKNYPSISIFLKPTDIFCANVGNLVKYTLMLNKTCADYFNKNGAIKKLNEYLSMNYCSDFAGKIEEKEEEETFDLQAEEVFENQLQKIRHRTIKVSDVIVIDDATIGEDALYIEDMTQGAVIICGTINEISEKTTKNGKPFFIISISDTTGRTSGVYFTRKNTYDKIKYLAEGDAIIARGTLGEYNGKRSFTFEKINRCTFPSDFVKKDRYKKSVPEKYSIVFPQKANLIKENTLFDFNLSLPSELTDNVYVVFDLETTGIDVMSNGITEIGAVKIINGVVTEEFTTLIKPDQYISEEIVKLTGITAEMVKDKPKISAVMPDFIRFIDGAILVAQNAEFDLKFIKRFAGADDFEIKNKVLDTMEMSRVLIPSLKRNNLKVLAEYFGVIFHHHRALSDAYATAEIFIELMKIKDKKQKEII